MKFSVDIKEVSTVVYLSVVCRHNLASSVIKSQGDVEAPAYKFVTFARTETTIPTAGVAYSVVRRGKTCHSTLRQKFCNITYFEGM